MFKKIKTPTPAQARKMSADGLTRKTQAAVNECIKTLNRYIEVAAEEGNCYTQTYFYNRSGYLTEMAFNRVAKHFQRLGYMVDVQVIQPKDAYEYLEFHIKLNWEE